MKCGEHPIPEIADIFKTNLIEGLRDPVDNLKLTVPIHGIIFLVTAVIFWTARTRFRRFLT